MIHTQTIIAWIIVVFVSSAASIGLFKVCMEQVDSEVPAISVLSKIYIYSFYLGCIIGIFCLVVWAFRLVFKSAF